MAERRLGMRPVQSPQGKPRRHAPAADAERANLARADLGEAGPPNYLHESWLDYLYWDSEIEN